MPVEVVQKDIKNLHVGVYPPDGRVRVAAPSHLNDEAIRLAIISRLGWIKKKQKGFKEQQRQSQREMVTGESHFFQGKRYLLDVIEKEEPPAVRILDNATLQLQVRPGSDREKRESVLQEWYRDYLKDQIPEMVAEWEPKLEVDVAEARVKRMKTLWGSCNAEARRIWLNLELAKKPPQCLEYIIVHEMIHFLERHHNDRFIALMDEHMPQWRLHRDESLR
jgi:predicted metal-dependent hydrolase